MNSESQHVTDAITRLFEGRLGDDEARRVYAHVRTCGACERIYERHAQAERHLYAAADDEVPSAAFERVSARLVTTPAPQRPRRRFAWVTIGALAAAAAGVVVIATPEANDSMSRRGGVEALDPAHAVRVLRVRVSGGDAIDVADATSTTLVEGDVLKFVYSTGPESRFVRLAVLDAAGRALADLPARPVERDVVEARLDGGVDVGAWPTGPVSIVAVFGPDAESVTEPIEARAPSDRGDLRVRVVQSRVEAPR